MLNFLQNSDRDLSSYRALTRFNSSACNDLSQRSIFGVLFYVLLWAIIYFVGDFDASQTALLQFLGFMLAAVSVGRLYIALRFKSLYAAFPLRWKLLFAFSTLASAAIWGGVSALALNFDGLGTTSMLVLLSTAGIAAGSVVSLAPATWLGGVFLLVLLSPISLAALHIGSDPARSLALLVMAFGAFMLLIWLRLHNEYWDALADRAELVLAKEAAEAATKAKSQFVANVSHELRTPLTSIIGALGLVEEEQKQDHSLAPHLMKLIDMAYQNGIQLSALINDILDFEKIVAGRMEFDCHPLALTPFLDHMLNLNRPYAQRYEVTLMMENHDDAGLIVADEQRLQQVMNNLLSNAAKHSPHGGIVMISASKQGDMMRVSVKDQGAGVPESFRDKIFGKFSQGENAANGTGLGLAISKGIIEGMNGQIGFDSVLGQGATFYFDLPVATMMHKP